MLAELQIASLCHTTELVAVGAHDVRSQKLLNAVAPFFLAMEEIMLAQTKTTVSKLTKQEICLVRKQVTEALYELEEHGLPNALNHLDLNPCNIIVSPSGCTFLDWAQAAVGNPFFSLEYLRQQFLQVFPGHMEAEQGFVNAYLGRWKLIRAHEFRETLLHLVPLTAAFAFAASALPWDDPKISQRPELAAFLRSLVRRMQRESEQIRASRAA
jgi:serine/threonine protein kinase